MNLKESYAKDHQSKDMDQSLYFNQRLFRTYNRIIKHVLGNELNGVNIDLGSGDQGFSRYLESIGIQSYPYDYPIFDIEKDTLTHSDKSIDFVTMNAVIEHIHNPDNIFKEINRILKDNGVILLRTPNWQLDYKNFYNDPTHVKPYTPSTIRSIFKLYGLQTIFLEPGLIEKSFFWWKLPNKIKWRVASILKGGTKSILAAGIKHD